MRFMYWGSHEDEVHTEVWRTFIVLSSHHRRFHKPGKRLIVGL